jgi:hypothetical protein
MIEEQRKFVHARLLLAQALLEEADALPGRSGCALESEEWWKHPRHEREALVVYLLLTCFDKLGQKQTFTTFAHWIESKRAHHVAERQDAMESCGPDASPLDIAGALSRHHQKLYGVRNAFYEGINGLPHDVCDKLLSTVRVTFCANFTSYPVNASPPSIPLEDKKRERELKLRYLFDKRNRFTHQLEQFHTSSIPLMSDFRGQQQGGASWMAFIRDSRLSYGGVQQDRVVTAEGDAYNYSVRDWPFALFESLYAAIELAFERTSIDLCFQVLLKSSKHPAEYVRLPSVRHKYMKDIAWLEKVAWDNPDANSQLIR